MRMRWRSSSRLHHRLASDQYRNEAVKSTKSDGFLDAVGNLLFDNPAAIPEMFVESLSSFLPATLKWLLPSAGIPVL